MQINKYKLGQEVYFIDKVLLGKGTIQFIEALFYPTYKEWKYTIFVNNFCRNFYIDECFIFLNEDEAFQELMKYFESHKTNGENQ